jgi:hypothetical protein
MVICLILYSPFAQRDPRGALLKGAKPRREGDALGARATQGGDRVEEHQPEERGKLCAMTQVHSQ